jgi:hypothetical protein
MLRLPAEAAFFSVNPPGVLRENLSGLVFYFHICQKKFNLHSTGNLMSQTRLLLVPTMSYLFSYERNDKINFYSLQGCWRHQQQQDILLFLFPFAGNT